MVHRKLRPFGLADGLAEDVKEGGRIEVLVSPIGTLTLLICKDFMDDHQSVATLLQEVPVDWVLVPSYGDERTVKGHRARAEQLAKVGPGTSCLIANQRNVEMSPGVALPGFAMGAPDATCQDVGEEGGPVRFDVPVRSADGPSPRRGHLKRVK